jgi:hypothetical protein
VNKKLKIFWVMQVTLFEKGICFQNFTGKSSWKTTVKEKKMKDAIETDLREIIIINYKFVKAKCLGKYQGPRTVKYMDMEDRFIA